MRLEALLGAGAICEVWLAEGPDGRRVALKLPKLEWVDRPEAIALLRREHAVLRELTHPHIVRSYGLIEHAGRPALTLELLDGGDLVALAGAAPEKWLPVVRKVIDALRHLHAAGWAHRDVKARNVLFDDAGEPRLIDFGSAERLGAPRPVGGATRGHGPAGPAGEPVGVADDAVALAALVYELAAGPLPPDDSGRAAAFAARRDAALPALTDALEALLRGPARPAGGSLSELFNVIESVAPTRA